MQNSDNRISSPRLLMRSRWGFTRLEYFKHSVHLPQHARLLLTGWRLGPSAQIEPSSIARRTPLTSARPDFCMPSVPNRFPSNYRSIFYTPDSKIRVSIKKTFMAQLSSHQEKISCFQNDNFDGSINQQQETVRYCFV